MEASKKDLNYMAILIADIRDAIKTSFEYKEILTNDDLIDKNDLQRAANWCGVCIDMLKKMGADYVE